MTYEEFVEQRKQGKTIGELIEVSKKSAISSSEKITPEVPPSPQKQPSIPSRIGGFASRAMEVPGALVAIPAQFARIITDLITKERNFGEATQSVGELNDRIINIPKEVVRGWTEGFWKQSDIPATSEALDLGKESLGGTAVNIAADVGLPSGSIRLGSKTGSEIGKRIPQISKVGEYVSGVAKPALKSLPSMEDFMINAQKASQKIQSNLNNLIKVDFGQTAKELLSESRKLGKTIAGKTIETMETLGDKSKKYGVPTDSWDNAKKYIEAAKENAGKVVKQVSEKAKAIDWNPVINELRDFVNNVAKIKGKKSVKEIKNIVDNIANELKKGGSDIGYSIRNTLEKLMEAKQRLLEPGEKILSMEDQIYDMAVKGIRTKLNEIEPIRQAQKAYTDLSQLSSKASEKISQLTANKEKLIQKAKELMIEGEKEARQNFEMAMKKTLESNRMMLENWQNRLKAFSIQKAVGQVIKKIPGAVGAVPALLNQAGQIIKQPFEKK